MVKINAKATDPLIDPDIETIDNYLLLTVHFFLKINLKMNDNPKIVINLANIHINNYKARKVNEITSCVK